MPWFFQNVIDQTRIIKNLMLDGFDVKAEDLKILSPYLIPHIKRFGDYVVDLTNSAAAWYWIYLFGLGKLKQNPMCC